MVRTGFVLGVELVVRTGPADGAVQFSLLTASTNARAARGTNPDRHFRGKSTPHIVGLDQLMDLVQLSVVVPTAPA
jgi:hypothetical protein